MYKKLLAVACVLFAYNVIFYGRHLPWFGTVGFFSVVLVANFFVVASFMSTHIDLKKKIAYGAISLSILSAFSALFRSSEIDLFFLGSASLFLGITGLYFSALTSNIFGSIMEILVLPLRVLIGWLSALGTIVIESPKIILYTKRFLPKIHFPSVSSETTGALIRAGVIAAFLCVVLLSLLTSADPIFGSFMKRFFSFQLPTLTWTLPQRFVLTSMLACLIIPVAFLKISIPFLSPFAKEKYAKYGLEAVVIGIAISLLLGAFLSIQFRYLFFTVPDVTLAQFGIATYSEYVRRGFGELLIASTIVYSVVAFLLVVYRQKGKHTDLIKKVNIVLLSETVILILSVLRRVFLYQSEHGLTRVRVYGTLFILMLLSLTVVLVLRHLAQKTKHWYLYEALIIVATIFCASFLSVDRLIATRFPPTVNGEVDYVYISRLSPDAVLGWVDAFEEVKSVANDENLISQAVFLPSEARRVVYAWRSLNSMQYKIERIMFLYGTKEEREQMQVRGRLTGITNQDQYLMNIGERLAYETLRQKISYADLIDTQIKIEVLHRRLTQEQQMAEFDRSSRSPLVR